MKTLLLVVLVALLAGCGDADYVAPAAGVPAYSSAPSKSVIAPIGIFSRYSSMGGGQIRFFTDKVSVDSPLNLPPSAMPTLGQPINIEYFADESGMSAQNYGFLRFGPTPQLAVDCVPSAGVAYDRLL